MSTQTSSCTLSQRGGCCEEKQSTVKGERVMSCAILGEVFTPLYRGYNQAETASTEEAHQKYIGGNDSLSGKREEKVQRRCERRCLLSVHKGNCRGECRWGAVSRERGSGRGGQRGSTGQTRGPCCEQDEKPLEDLG